ncbi:MAG TPA: nucleotidyltransferase family protein, partial [Chloroflexota bacterium]
MKPLLIPHASQSIEGFEHRPEAQLLYACARTQITDEQAERILHLAQCEIDWDSVLHLTRRDGVMPLLFRNLQICAPGAAPQGVMEQLAQECRDVGRGNLLTTAKLLQILDLLAAQGIPAMPFKGPVLAGAVYGDLGLRQFTDVDVLVHKSDALRAMDVLEGSSFRPDLPLSRPQQKAYLAYGAARHFVRADGLNLDLHWNLTHRSIFALDTESLWQRAVWVSLLGKRVETVG